MVPVKETSEGVTFIVKVHPRARKNAVTGVVGDALKLSLTAPPVEGRANEAIIEFFANLFEISRASVTIASGEASRTKRVLVTGLDRNAVLQRLNEILENW